METPETTAKLSSLRKTTFGQFMREKFSFLFNIRSLFYFFWFVFFVGMAWMAYGLVNNSFTQFYPWTDYFDQYVAMTFYYRDVWHTFFKTGYFELYSPSTYLGSDNIGSNSYYGLFDPFLFICYLFPRSWIPQTFALATMVKGAVGAMAMRAYLKYMGLSESTSRVGALAFAFNGWVNYFVGFPSFVSSAFTFPLILLGIEKVIKERKPMTLIMGLFLLGIISFFFLVVACVWGVIYALWRFFWTIRKRKAKENIMVIVLGIAGFAIGIAMSAWTLLPSVRESALSGRTSSIGKGYFDAILNAFKDKDIKTVIGYLFEPVGRNPIREMQALQAFFYPTIGYIELPLAGSGYDSWTSNAFIYTPLVVLFFIAFVNSIRNKKIGEIIAVLLCAYLMLTNLAYYMFYAFTGDGYGRWFIVLVPCAIYYACRELDHIKEEKKWVIFSGAFIALALAMTTWILTIIFVQDQRYDDWLDPYWPTSLSYVPYQIRGRDGIVRTCLWIVFYQLAMDMIVGMVIFFMKNHKHLNKVLMGIIATETIIWGNMSFVYKGTWNYEWRWLNGKGTRAELTSYGQRVLEDDPGYYRTYYDNIDERNSPYVWHTNGCSTFHSLFNYDVAQLSCYIGANRPMEYRGETYAYGEPYTSKSWSAFYGHKRFGVDVALSMKYYAIAHEGYSQWEGVGDNVPWGSELVYGNKDSLYRLYKNPYVEKMKLGHAVDHVYKRNVKENTFGQGDDFLSVGARGNLVGNAIELLRNDEVLMTGAILEDADAEELIAEDPSFHLDAPQEKNSLFTPVFYKGQIYECSTPDLNKYGKFEWWGTNQGREGPGYFADIIEKGTARAWLTDQTRYVDEKGNYVTTKDGFKTNSEFKYKGDTDIVALTPPSGTKYFNEDWNGACFSINYNLGADRYKTRVYMIGDRMNADGEIEENVLLSYEYWVLDNIKTWRISGSYSYDIFQMYPEGRVKYICFNAKPSDFAEGTFPANVNIHKSERSTIEGAFNQISDDEHNLTNVIYDKNKFTFESNFPTKKVVTTSVGYDAGWSVKATDEEGNVTYPKMLKVDGGLVGFVAPAGKVTYELTYLTPNLKVGAFASSAAWFVVAGYSMVTFAFEIKKKRKESMSVDAAKESEPQTSEPLKEKESEVVSPSGS